MGNGPIILFNKNVLCQIKYLDIYLVIEPLPLTTIKFFSVMFNNDT